MSRQELVLQELKKNGKRITGQRKIILDIILQQDWENCKDIYYEALKPELEKKEKEGMKNHD